MKLLKILIFGLIVILISRFVYSQWYGVDVANAQDIPAFGPFQQDIAICNGNINIGPNFAYVNNPTLFNEIDPNGQNVYFTDDAGNLLYSWYEGQLNYNGVTCDVWWVNLPNGLNYYSWTTIYMYIGPTSANYYQQYYPYVGASPQVISGYDNGQDVFIAYGYFNNTFDGWSGYNYAGFFSPTSTPYGIEMLNDQNSGGTYILPPNSANLPNIPLIVEEAWWYSDISEGNVIACGGNINDQITAGSIGSTVGSYTPVPANSTFVQFDYENGVTLLKSATTDQILGTTSFPQNGGTFYSYLIVDSYYYSSSSLVQAGWYYYGNPGVWVPLTLLDTYTVNNNAYVSSSINYYAFAYNGLEISAGAENGNSYQYIEWVVARSYPPNGVMPSISVQPPPAISSISLSPSSSSPVCSGTQTSSTVTASLNNPSSNAEEITITFSCSAPLGITCSVSPSSCTAYTGSSCSVTLYVNSSPSTPPGSYSVTVTASTFTGSSASTTYTYNVGPAISISSQSSLNFQNSYNIYITGCGQNYTLYVNNSPYCYDSYAEFQVINSQCTLSNPGSYSVYAQGCYNGTCVNSNTINLNIPSSGIAVPIIDINILNATNQNINTTISVNGSNQNIQSINVYYNNNNVYSNNNVNTNYYSFNLQLPYSNNGNITVCSTLTNGQSNCIIQLLYFDIIKIITYYGIIVGWYNK